MMSPRGALILVLFLGAILFRTGWPRPDARIGSTPPAALANATPLPPNPAPVPTVAPGTRTESSAPGTAQTAGRARDALALLPTATSPAESDFVAFQDWLRTRFSNSRSPSAGSDAEGLELARRRLDDLEDLIEGDPRRALELALPDELLAALPDSFAELVEKRVSGKGDLEVLCVLPPPGQAPVSPGIRRQVVLDGERYDAFVYGRRTRQPTLTNLSLHGIVIDRKMAVAESPVRGVGPAALRELLARLSSGTPVTCPVGAPHPVVPTAPAPVAVAAFGSATVLCSADHAAAYEATLVQAEAETAHAPAAASATTDAPFLRRVLFIRVDFADLIGESISANRASDLTRELHQFFFESSFGRAGFPAIGDGSDVTPVYRMPRNASAYGSTDDFAGLRSDARNAARAGGFVMSDYDLDVVCMGNVPGFRWAGLGYVGSRGAWIHDTTSTGVTAHEIGHNLGLNHANFWDTGGASATGSGKSIEYGDRFDTMGAANAGPNHFNARYKRYLGWLAPGEFTVTTTNGVYRIHALDQTNVVEGSRGLQIFYNSRTNAWLEFRQKFSSNKWLMNGVGLRWAGRDNESSLLLDSTPGSIRDDNDSAIVLGRTYSDATAQFHVTPISINRTKPASVDVMVQRGDFPDNQPPSLALAASAVSGNTSTAFRFTATASDPDGDPLAYHWEFGDEQLGTNAPAITHTWSGAGDYVVQCTVSDMRGGLFRTSVLVRVGSNNSTFRLAGRVLADGEPVVSARVAIGSGKVTLTDSDGSFHLADIAAGSYSLSAQKDGTTFNPAGFSNPITVSTDRIGLDFASSDVPLTRSLTLIPGGARWRYWDIGTLPSADWRRRDYDDQNWSEGPAILGYGGDKEVTVVKYGSSTAQRNITTWFRHAFVVEDPSELASVKIGLLRDDGAVVHLNGAELYRDNMPSGTINTNTRASTTVNGDAEITYWDHDVPASKFIAGTNVFAVEIHQSGPTSSDIGFALRLTADETLSLEPGIRLVRPVSGTPFRSLARIVASASVGPLPSPLDYVEFLADGQPVGRAARAPFVVTWTGASPGTHLLTARAVSQDGTLTDSTPVEVVVTDTANTPTLIRRGSRWRYLDTGVTPASSWTRADFDDAAWSEGPARLGYGEDGEATVLNFGPLESRKYITTWFRRAFEVTDPATITNLVCRLQRDDGAVVHLNGAELYRFGISATTLTPTLLAQADIRDNAEQTFFERSITPRNLVAGRNVIAVEMHQVSAASSDLGFDLELVAQRGPAVTERPALTWRLSADGLALRWPVRFQNWHVETSPVLGPEASWHRLNGTPSPIGADTVEYQVPADPAFYRLAP